MSPIRTSRRRVVQRKWGKRATTCSHRLSPRNSLCCFSQIASQRRSQSRSGLFRDGSTDPSIVPSTSTLKSKRVFDDRLNYSCKFTVTTNNCRVSLNPTRLLFPREQPLAFVIINFAWSRKAQRFFSLSISSFTLAR